MTDNEIIKAFDCCNNGWCDGRCPYYGREDIADCREQSGADQLDLINRLTAENANLTSHLTSLQNDLTSAKAEIERLRGVIEKTDAAFYQKVGEVDRAKADAIKVRCKDCKHRHKVNTGLAIWQVCHRLNRQTDDDFYCAYGERKDDNGCTSVFGEA